MGPALVIALACAGHVDVTVAVGAELAPAVRARVLERARDVVVDGDGALDVAIGDVAKTRALISAAEVSALPDEGFVVRSRVVDGRRLIAADGKGRGKSYGAYAVLEALGSRFLHPLAPSQVQPSLGDVDVREAPAFSVRNVHVHTMHPLELTDLLEGFPRDDTWSARLPEWDAYLEWLVANRQNEVEWVLLETSSWRDWSRGDERAKRLRTLVEHAHAFGLRVGLDAPIALTQQHAFRLVDGGGIDASVDWLFALGIDFVSTESGSTELTHPDAKTMLAWMNQVTRRARVHGGTARIKVHCSAGQRADGFVDVHTGDALDFNLLPLHADRALAVEPHTVQMFALDDKAPTYGNEDFRALRRFIGDVEGTRPVVWYPESAYWISVDVDVPLFLPVYARARIEDLRVLKKDGDRIDGQSLFSSGWEWGYWLNDVVAARAAWRGAAPDADVELAAILTPLIGSRAAAEVAATARDEHRLLVERGGAASLMGRDAFDDVFAWAGFPGTQPAKPKHVDAVLFAEIERTLAAHAAVLRDIAHDVHDRSDARAAHALRDTRDTRDATLGADLDELADAALVTSLRARHVLAMARGDLVGAASAREAALRVVRRREAAYRVPVERVAAFGISSPTSYRFGYLATVHDLFYWRRDEEMTAPLTGVCHGNIVDPVDVVFGDGALVDALRSVRGFTRGTFLDDAAACFAAAP